MIISAQQIDSSDGLTPAADLRRWADITMYKKTCDKCRSTNVKIVIVRSSGSNRRFRYADCGSETIINERIQRKSAQQD